jgi:hypothetical protein
MRNNVSTVVCDVVLVGDASSRALATMQDFAGHGYLTVFSVCFV